MAASDKVVVLSLWPSMFGMRVQIALGEKGVEYEYEEQDLFNKSPILLQMNPVHKKVPVLIHNGKPVCESMLIVQYIEETWPDRAPLLPTDPYQRAQARFWADFIDQKLYMLGRKVTFSPKGGEEYESGKKDLVGCLKQLEAELGGKKFFGGDTFGYVDIALVGFTPWFKTYDLYGDLNIEKECPKLISWGKICLERPSVSKSVPEPDRVLDFVLGLRIKIGVQ